MGHGKRPQSKRLLYLLDQNLIYKLYIHDSKYFLKATKPLPTPGTQYLIKEGLYTRVLFLSVTKHQSMNQKKSPCNEDTEYNFQSCVMNSITRHVGCRPPWDLGAKDLPMCDQIKDIKETF